MKVAVFYPEAQRHNLARIEEILTSCQCTWVTHNIHDVWNKGYGQNLLVLLDDSTHVIFLLNSDPFEDTAFVFVSGMAIGKNLPIFMLQEADPQHTHPLDACQLPENYRNIAVALPLDSCADYFMYEQQIFREFELKNAARRKLFNLGIPCINTNFILSVNNNELDTVELFLQAGFDPSLCDEQGIPLLSLAVRALHYDMAHLLISYGSSIDLCAKDRNHSPLMDAAQLGDTKLVELLLSKNADPNIKSKCGQTALIFAAARQDESIVKMLVEHQADWTISDDLGMSALAYAKLFHNQTIISYMQER
ncbi:MAG: ankyrin repeat domain-containing protein [Treponema sp.]